MEELSLRDIFKIFGRRKKVFFVTFSVLLLISLIGVFNWTNYRSTATVQIAASFVSKDITNPLTNPNEDMEELADQRISQIEQKVTSLESLSQIISKFGLYPGEADTTPIAILTAGMRKKIKVEFISGTLANPAAAQKQTAEQLSAIAFELSFDYKDPQKAQQVTDELVTRFLDEDLKMRRMQAQETSAFLQSQIKALEESMASQEKSIADFRKEHGESGPSALMFNQQAAENLTLSIASVESQLTSNEGTIGALRAQLATVEPYSRVLADGQLLTTPATQLKALEAQYATLTSQYGPEHPDVIKLRSQIEALKKQVAPEHMNAQLEAQIADVRTNLAAAKSTQGPDHPDVVALEKELAKLEATLKANGGDPAKAKAKSAESGDIDAVRDNIKEDADNPAYLELSSQLKSAEMQHKALLKQRDELKAQQEKFQKNIVADPIIEQEMSKLTRDYENSQLRYRELKEKKMSADMNEQLETDRKGQRLEVINPPAIPDDTHPKRILLLLGGVIISMMGGLGSVTLAEATNQNIYGIHHVSQVVGTVPFVTIPHMTTLSEKDASTRYKPYVDSGVTIFKLLKILVVRFILKPLLALVVFLRRLKPSKTL